MRGDSMQISKKKKEKKEDFRAKLLETSVGCANICQYSYILFQLNFAKTGLAEMGPEGKLSKKILAEFTVGLKAF